MAIFNLKFLLKARQVEMCQNPSPISTNFFPLNSPQKCDLDVIYVLPLFSPKINRFHFKKIPPHFDKIWSGILFPPANFKIHSPLFPRKIFPFGPRIDSPKIIFQKIISGKKNESGLPITL